MKQQSPIRQGQTVLRRQPGERDKWNESSPPPGTRSILHAAAHGMLCLIWHHVRTWAVLPLLLLAAAASGADGEATSVPASPPAGASQWLSIGQSSVQTVQAGEKHGGNEAAKAGEPAGDSDQALVKKLSNPIASLISFPVQFNCDRGYRPTGDGHREFVNIQPVIPFSLSRDWNLISRTILPVIHQEEMAPCLESQCGLGDVVQSFFLSPSKPGPGGIIWGAGPVLQFPTATHDLLGAEKWGAGPTAVALRQSGPWTVGALANHIWSFAGENGREDVNATFLQPFVSFSTKDAWTFGLNAESTFDWNSHEWSVPINFSISKLLKLGKLPVQIGGGVRYWAASTEQGPEGWGARLTITFLLPK